MCEAIKNASMKLSSIPSKSNIQIIISQEDDKLDNEESADCDHCCGHDETDNIDVIIEEDESNKNLLDSNETLQEFSTPKTPKQPDLPRQQRPHITRDVSKVPIAEQTYTEHQEYLRLYSGRQNIMKQRIARLKYLDTLRKNSQAERRSSTSNLRRTGSREDFNADNETNQSFREYPYDTDQMVGTADGGTERMDPYKAAKEFFTQQKLMIKTGQPMKLSAYTANMYKDYPIYTGETDPDKIYKWLFPDEEINK